MAWRSPVPGAAFDLRAGDAEMRLVLEQLIPDTQLRSWTKSIMNGGMLRVMPYTISVH